LILLQTDNQYGGNSKPFRNKIWCQSREVQTVPDTITPFGGINFLIDAFRKFGINKLVNKQLGKRAPNASYSYVDVFAAWWSIIFCGVDCAENIQEHLKDTLCAHPGMKVPSADVLLSAPKELTTTVITHISK
jgi:hypothetical protein